MKIITVKILKKKGIQIRLEKLLQIEDEAEFKLQTGVKRLVFFQMLDILTKEFDKKHIKGSFKGIGPGCKLVLALSYWREYRAMRQMALDYDVAPSTICDSIKWVEITLANNSLFQLDDIKTEIEKLEQTGNKVECIIGDVEEQPIERPKVNLEESYSGKKKMHTTKNQIIIDEKTQMIINVFNAKGTMHDYKMIQESNITDTLNEKGIKGKFDSGYQGIQNLMTAIIPFKKSKYHELTEEEKNHNTKLSSERIKIEHVNRTIKIFRIMKEKYRNHMNRYDEKLNIIVGIYNLNLGK